MAAVSSTRLQSWTEKWKTSRRFLCLVHIESPTSPRCIHVVAGSQDGEVPSPVAGHTVGLGLDGSEVSNFLQWMAQVWDATGQTMQIARLVRPDTPQCFTAPLGISQVFATHWRGRRGGLGGVWS